jgi:hypothetical protein
MRTDALVKLLRIEPLRVHEIYEVMGGALDAVETAMRDAKERGLIAYRNFGGGRFYYAK